LVAKKTSLSHKIATFTMTRVIPATEREKQHVTNGDAEIVNSHSSALTLTRPVLQHIILLFYAILIIVI